MLTMLLTCKNHMEPFAQKNNNEIELDTTYDFQLEYQGDRPFKLY